MNEKNTQNVIPNVNSKGQEERNVPDLRFKRYDFPWVKVPLKNLLKFQNGINADSSKYGKGTKYISVTDILNNKYITYENIKGLINIDEATKNRFLVEYGDILFQRSSETFLDIGRSNVYLDKESSATFGGFVIRGKKINDYDPLFFKYLLDSTNSRKKIIKMGAGAQHFNIGQEGLESIELYFPCKSEQIKIGELFSYLDDRIIAQKKIIEDLLSSKNIIKNKMIHKAKEIGNYYTLKELGQYFNGVAHENNISEQGYVLINSKFISSDGTIKKHVNDSSFVLKKNDICIVLSDLPNGKALSKCFFVNKDNYYALNQRIACIRTNDISFSKYLYYYLSRNDYFLKFDDGVSQTNLKKDDVLNCPIYYSDFVKKYIEYLEIIDIKIKNEKQILLLYEQQKQYLLDKMFI